VDFKNTILIMTSNLRENELRERMRPEFLNRIDEIIVFDQLSKDDIRKIVQIQLRLLSETLSKNNVELRWTPAFETLMTERGYDPDYGARPVKRLIQRELVNKLATSVLDGTIRKDGAVEVDAAGGEVVVRNR